MLFPYFRGRGGTSRGGEVGRGAEGGGPERGGGGEGQGAGATKVVLPFGKLRLLFFSKAKNDPGSEGPGPSPSRTSSTNMNIQCFPLAMGERGGTRVRAHHTRWVWNAGWKLTHIRCSLSSF